MAITVFRSIGGYCDYLNRGYEIKVRFQQKQLVGQPHPVNIPTGFECPHANKCQRGSECPLWKNVRKMII